MAEHRTSKARLVVPPWVLAADAGEAVVLVDLRSEEYYTLRGAGAQAWRLIASGRHEGLTQAEGRAADVLADRRLLVLAEEVESARDAGRASRAKRRSSTRVPHLAVCLFALAAARLALKRRGLSGAIRWIRLPQPGSDFRLPSRDVLATAADRVRLAAIFCPFRAQCLEKSLVLLWILSRMGFNAELRLGVLPVPFQAHAWIEVAGRPVGDDPETLRLYRPFPPVNLSHLGWS